MKKELETERLLLRPRAPSDSALQRELWAERDPRSRRLISADGRPTVEEMSAMIATQLAESEVTGLHLLNIERKGEPGVLGYCGLIMGDATLDEPEIAYELFRSAQGHGYATEAAGAVIAAARETGRTRLWATVREWNVASLRVLEKHDFIDSGRRTLDRERGDTVWMTLDLAKKRLARVRPQHGPR
jgi:RimJ/RimL family protein N-acetyltransferase